MSNIISDLSINGHIDLIKVLYKAGHYPNKDCIDNAIEYGNIDIIEWLISIKYEITEINLHHCIYKDRLEIFRKIYNLTHNLNKNSIFNYAILYNKIFFITTMYLDGCEINIDNIICALFSKNDMVVNWLLDLFIIFNNNIFKYLVDIIKLKCTNDVYINKKIYNYYLLYNLNKLDSEKDIIIESNLFLYINKDIEYDIVIRYDNYIYPILFASFLSNNMNTIFAIIIKNKFICNLNKLIDDFIYNKYNLILSDKQINNFFTSFELFNKVDTINVYTNIYRDNIFSKIKDNFFDKSFIIYTKLDMNFIINTPFIYNNWNEAIDDEKFIYIDDKDYGYIIPELFKHWKMNLNAYNYGIVPKYPTNPYTNELINPIELYRIIIYATTEQVKLPFILKFFIKHPTIVLKSYYKFNTIEEHKNDHSYYLKDLFINNGLKYVDSVAELNEGGKWKYDYSVNDESYNFLYNTINISYEISLLLFFYISNNIY